jgi:hypothetical protein
VKLRKNYQMLLTQIDDYLIKLFDHLKESGFNKIKTISLYFVSKAGFDQDSISYLIRSMLLIFGISILSDNDNQFESLEDIGKQLSKILLSIDRYYDIRLDSSIVESELAEANASKDSQLAEVCDNLEAESFADFLESKYKALIGNNERHNEKTVRLAEHPKKNQEDMLIQLDCLTYQSDMPLPKSDNARWAQLELIQ